LALPLLNSNVRLKVTQSVPRIIANVPLSKQVGQIAVNPATNRVYFTFEDRGLGVLDGRTNRVIGTVSTGEMPSFIAINSRTNRIYVTNWLDGSVSVINGSTNRVIKTIPIGERCDEIAVNTRTNRVYVASISLSSSISVLTVINGRTNTILKRISIRGRFSTIVIDEETNRIYTTNTGNSTVNVVDGSRNVIVLTRRVGRNPVITPVLNKQVQRLYIPNNLSRYCSILNLRTNTVRKLQLGRLQSGIVMNPMTNRVYIESAQVISKGRLFVINCLTDRVIRTKTIPTFSSIFINPNTNHLYLTEYEDFGPGSLTVYNASTLKPIVVLHPGERSGGEALNRITNRIYMGGEKKIIVIQD
jgi:YVTN family beta-propeller protein